MWINMDKRQPKDGERVLVFASTKWSKPHITVRMFHKKIEKGVRKTWWSKHAHDVTHWMPLPDVPGANDGLTDEVKRITEALDYLAMDRVPANGFKLPPQWVLNENVYREDLMKMASSLIKELAYRNARFQNLLRL